MGNILGYKETIDPIHYREFAKEQIIYVYNPNPLNRKEAYSIFDAAKDYQYTINKGTQFAQNALLNNINTPGILSVDEVLNDEEYDNLISRINSHEPGKAIVTDGTGKLTYTPISQDIDNAALPSLTEISRQTIFAVTGTSKTILGIEESGVTRETARVQDKKFIKRTISPVAHTIVSALNFDYRVRYPSEYDLHKIKLSVKAIYDPTETQEQFATQQSLFDGVTKIIYSGYTKESAENFMYGDISFTDLELDSSGANEVSEEKENIPKSSQESTEDTKEQTINISNQDSEFHTHDEPNDFLKALSTHVNSTGELDDFGKELNTKLTSASKNLLKEIRTIQAEAINQVNTKIAINSFDYEDIRTDKQEQTIIDKIKNAFKRYWYLVLPLIGKERLSEDEASTGLQANVNLLGTQKVKDYIEEISSKTAKSHAQTIYKTILDATNKAVNKLVKTTFADEYLKNYKQGEDKWFKSLPSKRQIESKLSNDNFVSDNKSLYDKVQKKISEGLGRNEIQKAIRSEYQNLSKQRAEMLVDNEIARSVNHSQYIADYELLKTTNTLHKAYKELVSGTGDPCPVCKAIIDKGQIPFEEPFMKLDDTIEVKNNDKTTVFTCNYENIESGVVHCRCKCHYKLILR
jgi:hypothetical protein